MELVNIPEMDKAMLDILMWLAYKSYGKYIEMVDGDFYFSDDKDGDQPMDAHDILKLYKDEFA